MPATGTLTKKVMAVDIFLYFHVQQNQNVDIQNAFQQLKSRRLQPRLQVLINRKFWMLMANILTSVNAEYNI